MFNVLLLDDDENMQRLLEFYLGKCNMKAAIDQVYSIEDAEASLVKKDYDLWIVDHKLNNDKRGLDFITRHSTKHKPFIYGSFYLNDAIRDEVLKYGGIPVDKNDLMAEPENIGNAIRSLQVA